MVGEKWITTALSRLETLEAQKHALEASGCLVSSDICEEIAALYDTLEQIAAANEAEQESVAATDTKVASNAASNAVFTATSAVPAPAFDDAPTSSFQPFATGAANGASLLWDDPFGSSVASAPPVVPSACAAEVSTQTFGAVQSWPAMDDLDDIRPIKNRAPLYLLLTAIVVGGGGVAAVMAMRHSQQAEQAPVAPTQVTVIQASSVPEDTQGPKGAQGATVSKTNAAVYKEGPAPAHAPSRAAGTRNHDAVPEPAAAPKVGQKTVPSNPDDSARDPLAGLK